MQKKQPTTQKPQPVKRPVAPSEPSIPEQIAELLARALARLNGATVPVTVSAF